MKDKNEYKRCGCSINVCSVSLLFPSKTGLAETRGPFLSHLHAIHGHRTEKKKTKKIDEQMNGRIATCSDQRMLQSGQQTFGTSDGGGLGRTNQEGT